jgi:hypothetical protein
LDHAVEMLLRGWLDLGHLGDVADEPVVEVGHQLLGLSPGELEPESGATTIDAHARDIISSCQAQRAESRYFGHWYFGHWSSF